MTAEARPASYAGCTHLCFRPGLRCIMLSVFILLLGLVFAPPASAGISLDKPIAAMILYDGSGSMYPGYSPGKFGRTALNVGFVHQNAGFKSWLKSFIAQQPSCNVNTVSLEAFKGRNERIALLPETAIGRANMDQALQNFETYVARNGIGQKTYLEEQLAQASASFEGLLWFITDNVIDTNNSPEVSDVKRLLLSIRNTPRYRSAFMFKLPVTDGDKTLNVAVYGLLVSNADLPHDTLAWFDERIRRMASLFDGGEYVKFKDLSVNPVSLERDINITPIESNRTGLFTENHTIQMERGWKIISKLTQHSIEKAVCSITFSQPFVPDDRSVRQFGVKNIEAKAFGNIVSDVAPPDISPRAERQISTKLRSTQDITISPKDFLNKIKLAWSGAVVEYSGVATVRLSGVQLKLVPQRLSNIYGIDQAAEIFGFEKMVTLGDIPPLQIPVFFKVATGTGRALPLVAVLLLIIAAMCALVWRMLKKEFCKVSVEGGGESIALMRLGRQTLMHSGVTLGQLRRSLGGDWLFRPDTTRAAVSIQPTATPGKYTVKVNASSQGEAHFFTFALEPLKGRLLLVSGRGPGGSRPGHGGAPHQGPKSGPKPLRK